MRYLPLLNNISENLYCKNIFKVIVAKNSSWYDLVDIFLPSWPAKAHKKKKKGVMEV